MRATLRAKMVMVLPALVLGLAVGSAEAQDAGVHPAVTEHVVVISIDGLRPDAIDRFELRAIQRLAAGGREAANARTIFPSKTLPSHTSMLTGRTPEHHGITWNSESDARGNVQVPTVFEVARDRGLSTAAFFSKAKFRHLEREGAYDYWQAPASNADNWMATRTVADAVQYLQHRRPNLLFVHIGDADYAGHALGWMGFFYGLAVRRADAGVERLIEAADDAYGAGNYTVILTADHGGHDHTHGTAAAEDMTIPWLAWGRGVIPDGASPLGVRTMDTAATALWLLGVPVPTDWEGRPVSSIFRAPVLSAADGA